MSVTAFITQALHYNQQMNVHIQPTNIHGNDKLGSYEDLAQNITAINNKENLNTTWYGSINMKLEYNKAG